ncbi:Peptidase M23 [Anaeromyxobacter dehalogenans 2CP-1]|uniref:Peptidase M23 n=1 Tax=Anaeromyxobacter dehalogenans (strain ATCC BAA-258 / DSM 21875 / 2CP-1) TaxID=455488 RepID=B8JD94_ANAD2|nr:peptidoglycan DD-metalloendopeptidase family protein [Anaeromyxobacter dehalogenans]ACL65943.1 Peptidase M23 [Anaeromyxobacter dehalogenans 2CP-1]
MIAPAAAPAADPRLREAAQALEAMLLREIVKTSGAFRGGEGAGAGVRADLFADALSDAVARSGGIGLAGEITRSLGGAGDPAPAPPAGPSLPRGVAPGALAAPLLGRLTSAFGPRADPLTGAATRHDGVDVAAPEGTPVRAPAAGVVVRAGPRGGYGNAVEVDHGGGLLTLYGHAAEVRVRPGQVVAAGDELALVGSTGRSTGPHLHFEVRMRGRAIDPARALKIYAQRADERGRSGP